MRFRFIKIFIFHYKYVATLINKVNHPCCFLLTTMSSKIFKTKLFTTISIASFNLLHSIFLTYLHIIPANIFPSDISKLDTKYLNCESSFFFFNGILNFVVRYFEGRIKIFTKHVHLYIERLVFGCKKLWHGFERQFLL